MVPVSVANTWILFSCEARLENEIPSCHMLIHCRHCSGPAVPAVSAFKNRITPRATYPSLAAFAGGHKRVSEEEHCKIRLTEEEMGSQIGGWQMELRGTYSTDGALSGADHRVSLIVGRFR